LSIKQAIKNYIEKKYSTKIENSTSLINNGIIDDEGVAIFTLFLEDTFYVQIDDEEITPENFGTINKLEMFIKKKMQ